MDGSRQVFEGRNDKSFVVCVIDKEKRKTWLE
jgi:hypothetical protein